MPRDRSSEKLLHKQRIANGECMNHPGVPFGKNSKTLCDNCLQARMEAKRIKRALGKCRNCADRKPEPGMSSCRICLDKANLRKKMAVKNGKCEQHPGRPLAKNSKCHCEECMESLKWKRFYRQYSITKEKYIENCNYRNYKCDICKESCKMAGFGSKLSTTFHVDHCHKTKIVRGFLCHPCNIMIGRYYEDPKRLKNFIDTVLGYLDGTKRTRII